MTADEILKLRDEIQGQIEAGASTEEIEQWADAYTFSRRDLVEVARLLVDEIENFRQLLDEGKGETL